MKDVAGQTRRVHTHEHIIVFVDLSHHQRDVLFAVDVALICVDAKVAVLGRQTRRRQTMDVPLVLHPILNDVGDGDDLEAVLEGEVAQVRQARHRPVFIHDLADHRARIHPGDLREIDARFRLSGALEHSTLFRAQRKDVTRTREIVRTRLRIDRRAHRFSAIGRGDSRRDPAPRFDRHRERRAVRRRVVLHHQRQIQLFASLFRQREADQSAAVFGHEVDRIRRDLLRGDAEIAFVLAIFVVDDDHELAAAIEVRGFLDRCKWHGVITRR